jgi:hypothetical protein
MAVGRVRPKHTASAAHVTCGQQSLRDAAVGCVTAIGQRVDIGVKRLAIVGSKRLPPRKQLRARRGLKLVGVERPG